MTDRADPGSAAPPLGALPPGLDPAMVERLSRLSPAKRAVFLAGLGIVPAAATGARERTSEIGPRPSSETAPVSFAQEMLWVMHEAAPDEHAYNAPRAYALKGPLDERALRQALDAHVERHEVYRSTMRSEGDAVVQRIHPARPVEWRHDDLRPMLRALDEVGREAAIRARVRSAVRVPFDLAADQLLRAALLRTGDDTHVLVLVSHHVASDGWSRGLMFREIAALYAAARAGRAHALPPVAVQYADFAVWQRATLVGERLERGLAFWRAALAGAPRLLEVPADRPRPAAPSSEGFRVSAGAGPALSAQVRAFARASGATPFMVLLAAWQLLLLRLSRQRDILIGTPVAGRRQPELHDVIGYFADTVIIRAQVDADLTVAGLVAQVRDRSLAAFEHQEVPYEKLVKELAHERGGSLAPLFQSLFVMHDDTPARLELEGVEVTSQATDGGWTKADIGLSVSDRPAELHFTIEARSDLFDRERMVRVLESYTTLLASMVADPAQRVLTAPIVGAADVARLAAWNDTARPYPEHETLVACIERAAREQPRAIAVQEDDDAVTYADLVARASVVARHLRASGARPGHGVALFLERSVDLVVAMIATLKAGAHYVPLDPDYPRERIAYMLGDAEPAILVTSTRQVGRIDVRAGLPVLLIDALALDGTTAEPLDDAALPDDLAYIIYTSGSTGRPKGTMIPNRAVVNYLEWMRGAIGLTAADTVLQKAPASFDASIWEFFLPLVTGARLLLARAGAHQDPDYLVASVVELGVTVLQLVPSQLRMVLEAEGAAALGRLRVLVLGGEALPGDLLARLDAVAAVSLFNLYGPTECTVYATSWHHDPRIDGAWDGRAVPIGAPVTNARIEIVDPDTLAPMPVGVPGELVIGGAQVARGYHAQPTLTAEKFVPDPQPHGPAWARTRYRTGDLARWSADGIVEYLGRIDSQVKVRGFRVELGEIEEALARHPSVSQSVVLLREDVPGDQRLVAYVGGDLGGLASDDEFRTFLRAGLPDFMLPAVFVRLASIPLNANGKADRKALPAPSEQPGTAAASGATETLAPRTPIEQDLLAIWQPLLGGRALGVRDDFFAVGGHSLLALRVIARIADRWQVRLPLRVLFEAPTIEQLAKRVATAVAAGAMPLDAPITRRQGVDAPLSPAQELLWHLQLASPEHNAYNVPSIRRLRGPLDPSALGTALQGLVDRHEVLRSTFISVAGRPVQRPGDARVAFVHRAFGGAADEGAALAWIREEARRPFDLTSAPPFRAALADLGADEHLLLLVAHHVAFDAASFGVVASDLAALYAAARAGTEAVLPPLPVQFGDVAAWLRARVDAGVIARQLAYWRERLDGATRVVELPTVATTVAAARAVGDKRVRRLSAHVQARVEAVARESGASVYHVLLAAFAAVLHRYTSQEDIVLGTVMLGRDRRELEPMVGYLSNTLPLRVAAAPDVSFRSLVQEVRDRALAAAEHAEVPFEQLVDEVGGPDGALFNVAFVLQPRGGGTRELDGTTSESIASSGSIAKFDLLLSMTELGDGLRASLEFRTDRLAADTAERMLGHLDVLLTGAVTHPDSALRALPLLSPTEEREVRTAWQGGALALPPHATIHGLVEAQVARTPSAVALVHEADELTYAELDRRAESVAAHLRALGVGAGVPVGVCLARSMELVVALLGVLKAGGAYVPLDPAYPDDRNAFVLNDADASIVLTEPTLAGAFGGVVPHVLEVATLVATSAPHATPPRRTVREDDLAYLIYTSGSTGRPKGVMLEHRNAVALITWAQTLFTAADLTGMLFGTSICFDLSVFELFVPLASGGTIIVAENALALPTLAAANRVTFLNTVPSAAAALLREGGIPRSVRTVILAGEPLPTATVNALYDLGTVERVYDMYGPTEDTTYSTFALRAPNAGATIGRPIANSQAYIVDPRGALLPVGVPGELILAGAGVTRGYLARADLTAERFIPDPFASAPGSRAYRTGDRVRWRADGNLEYLGRFDHQVKIRGFRVEQGEVQAALEDAPGVAEAAVIARPDASGALQLIAYVVGAPDADAALLDDAALRQSLRQRLPAFMLPSSIMRLAHFPRTPNGKLDRAALPDPGTSAPVTYVEPVTATEHAVARALATVMRVPQVGRDDDFFALGGHSLLALRVVSSLRDTLGRVVPMRLVLEHPRVADLATAIDAAARAASAPAPTRIVAAAREGLRRPRKSPS